MKSSIDSAIGFNLYVTPASSTVSSSPLQVLKRGIAFLIHRPSASTVHRQILSIESPSHPSIQPSVNPRHCRSLTSPQKGDSFSDPCFILGPTASPSSSLSLQRINFRKLFSNHHSVNPPLPRSPQKGDSLRLSDPCIRP
jgi:hypothetical protein